MTDKYLVEVRVSDPGYDKQTIMGYFPPESIEPLITVMKIYPIYSEGNDDCIVGGCQFVVDETKTYFEICIEHPDEIEK